MDVTFGSKLRELRKARGWTLETLQAALGTQRGMSYSQLSRWELENRNPPDPRTPRGWAKLLALATALVPERAAEVASELASLVLLPGEGLEPARSALRADFLRRDRPRK